MIKIDRDIRRLSDVVGFVKNKPCFIVDKKLIEYMEHYYMENHWDRLPKQKLSLFERLYKWFKNKMEK